MPTFDCQVTWPTDPTQGDLIVPQLRPQHRCVLDAQHVHERFDGYAPWFNGAGTPPIPHTCHCGETLPVRDVEPAVQS